MPFTMEQVEAVANATLDFYWKKGTPRAQYTQERPLLSMLRKNQKTIPGGRGYIDIPVVLDTVSTLQGFQYDDPVTYANPNRIRRARYPWRLFHIGIQVTMHELLHDGISVVDSTTGEKTVEHNDRERTMLVNLLEHKIADMEEGYDRDLNLLDWRDGTQSALAFAGITGLISDSPSSGVVVGGIDQVANPKWQNRANTNITLGADASTMAVIRTLDAEVPQLRRYGGKPNVGFAGAAMIDRLKAEYRSKGNFTLEGFAKGGDLSVGELTFNGLTIYYDPTLDDLGRSKYLYLLDMRRIFQFVIEGEDGKEHHPARPEDRYTFYRAKTWVGGLATDQRNAHGVYAFP